MITEHLALSVPPSDLKPQAGTSRLANFGRFLLATLSVSLVSFATTPRAEAAKVNGKYQVQRARGSVKFDGDTLEIPESLVKRIAGVVNGSVSIHQQTLKLKPKGTVRIIENLADELNLEVEAGVTGPSTVELKKSGKTVSGKTTRPIVTSFEASFFGEDLSGELKTRVSATVKGKTLTVVVRFSGSAVGSDFSGRVTLVAKR